MESIISYEDELKQRVLQKVTKEYDNFIKELKKEQPEVIIERAYEKICKQEMVYTFEKLNLEVNEYKALLKCSGILEECYTKWLKSDGNFNELLEDIVENTVEGITSNFKLEQKRNNNKNSR